MLDQVNATPTPHKRLPWNKGKLTGARQPLRLKHVWSIRTKLQIECRARDLAMFKLAIDSKLRGCNLAHERPLCARSGHSFELHSDPAAHARLTKQHRARLLPTTLLASSCRRQRRSQNLALKLRRSHGPNRSLLRSNQHGPPI